MTRLAPFSGTTSCTSVELDCSLRPMALACSHLELYFEFEGRRYEFPTGINTSAPRNSQIYFNRRTSPCFPRIFVDNVTKAPRAELSM
jgi:hypothetical protein